MSGQTPLPRAEYGPVTVCFGTKNGKYPDGNQVLVRGREALAAFDTPISSNTIGRPFDDAELVILSHVHEDHMCGLQRLPHVPVHVHHDDLPAARSWDALAAAYGTSADRLPEMRASFERDFFYAPRPDAVGYADGAEFDLGGVRVRAIHAPGHTAGHSILLVDPAGVAFIGDIDLSGFGPYYGDACSSLADFRRSLALLPTIPAKVWITFHHRGVYTDRDQLLRDLQVYGAKLEERDAKLLDMLRAAPQTLAELVRRRVIYPRDFDEVWVDDCERRMIEQHLDEMVADGRLEVDEGGVYRPRQPGRRRSV